MSRQSWPRQRCSVMHDGPWVRMTKTNVLQRCTHDRDTHPIEMRALQRRSHDIDACTTEGFFCDRDFFVATDLYSDKKKKKDPWYLGCCMKRIEMAPYENLWYGD